MYLYATGLCNVACLVTPGYSTYPLWDSKSCGYQLESKSIMRIMYYLPKKYQLSNCRTVFKDPADVYKKCRMASGVSGLRQAHSR